MAVAICLVAPLSQACENAPPLSERSPAEDSLLHRMLTVEDARAAPGEPLRPLGDGLAHENAQVRRVAVRALGRLGHPVLAGELSRMLDDPDAGVRAEAAGALALLGQAGAAEAVRASLLEHLAAESDPTLRGVIAEALGRTPHTLDADMAVSANAIVASARRAEASGADAPEVQRRHALALFRLASQPLVRPVPTDSALTWLTERVRAAPAGASADLDTSQGRASALAALEAYRQVTLEDLRAAFQNGSAPARRQAILATRVTDDRQAALSLFGEGLRDASPIVRVEAVRGWAANSQDCDPLLQAARDPHPHVALEAIDMLGGCIANPEVLELLDSLALALPTRGDGIQRAARALVSLAAQDPERANLRLERFLRHARPFARVWAARAAVGTGNQEALVALAGESDAEVRAAALEGLLSMRGGAVDSLLVSQLGSEDPYLIGRVASLLEASVHPGALAALLGALERLTATGHETTRAARLALLERILQLGGPAQRGSLTPLLSDFDPVVANRAADVIAVWTGSRPPADPRPLPREPVPTPAELDALERATFRIELDEGASFDVRLLAWEAPANASRFARLAEDGHYDGRAFHTVLPNFIAQGGGLGDLQYASGVSRFTRDELGIVPQRRGILGVVRDTPDSGDGQFFVNLVDNPALDYQHTAFAEVVQGMEVVERIVEGTVIRRITRR